MWYAIHLGFGEEILSPTFAPGVLLIWGQVFGVVTEKKEVMDHNSGSMYRACIGIEKKTLSVAALISIVISRLKGTVSVLKTIISAEADSLSELAELAGAFVCLLLVSVGW